MCGVPLNNHLLSRLTLLVLVLLLGLLWSGIARALGPHELPALEMRTFQRSSDHWPVTTQAEFEEGILNGVDTSSSPGDAKLAVRPVGTMSVLPGTEVVDDRVPVDCCSIRKHASPEPTTGVGYEEGRRRLSGAVVSRVYDTREVGASWDLLGWDATLPAGTDIAFDVRASDSPFLKDNTALPWQDASVLPAGRYQQWRATLTSSASNGETPVLHEVWAFRSWQSLP